MIKSAMIGVLLAALPAVSFADVDCKQVMTELKAGRTPQDLLDTMRIQDKDLKACQKAADRDAQVARARGDEDAPDGQTAVPDGSKAR
jgi:hypothetical protein